MRNSRKINLGKPLFYYATNKIISRNIGRQRYTRIDNLEEASPYSTKKLTK